MDFSQVKKWIIPEGEVKKVVNVLDSTVLWQAIQRVLKEWRGLSPLLCTPTIAGEFENIRVYGQSVQTSARTKNLFDPAILAQGNYTSDITTRVCGKLDLKNNTDYTISITGDYEMFVGWFDKGTKTSAGNLGTWFKNNVTISSNNIDTDLYDYVLIIRNYSNTTLLLKKFGGNIQLEEGTTATSFVPYIATTPTPDTPIPVESVGDRTINLFDKTTATTGGYLTVSGTWGSGSNSKHLEFLEIPQGVSYVSRFTKDWTSTDQNYVTRVAFYDENKTHIRTETGFGNGATFTIAIPTTAKYIQCSIHNKDVENSVIYWGNETITDYIPYGYQIPVVVGGKNLFNKNSTPFKVDFYINANNTTIGSNDFAYSGLASFDVYKLKIKPNTTYTFISKGSSPSYGTTDKDGIVLTATRYAGGLVNKIITFTSLENAEWLYISVGKSGDYTFIDDLQLEEGSTSTPYQPYIEPTTTNIYLSEPLRKIGEYADYIDFEGQKVVRNIDNKQLDSLTWSASSQGLGRFWSDGIKENVNIELPCFSNVFVGIGIGFYTENSISYERGTNKGRMYVGYKLDVSTKDDFVNMLNSTNAYIYYPLATPTEEQITLPAINALDNTTVINVDTVITPSEVYASEWVEE